MKAMYTTYARRVIKGGKDIKKNHDYTILRQVFDVARGGGGDDWIIEDRLFIKQGRKEDRVGRLGRLTRLIRLGIGTSSPT